MKLITNCKEFMMMYVVSVHRNMIVGKCNSSSRDCRIHDPAITDLMMKIKIITQIQN